VLIGRLAKEGVWRKGRINNVVSDIFVDTGAQYTIIDFGFWRKLCFDNTIVGTPVRLVGAGGESLKLLVRVKFG